jgi:C4-dicarboxylate-specific signal transduction histidine kinase
MRVTMMGELATSIAHEVNQPLAAIVGSCGACRRWLDGRDWIRAKESLETMSKAADRAGEVIKRVRSLTSNATPEYLDVDVNVAVQEVLAVLRAELRIRNTTLHLQLDNNIPHVKGDKVQLQQVVLNLVMNAIEAMTTMKDRRRVLAIKSAVEDGDVRVTVQDSGPGLDAATTERIFDPFFTTKPDGMGMGLSISKSIVENHGGRLWAAPVSGGTAFHFNVPTARRGEQWAN